MLRREMRRGRLEVRDECKVLSSRARFIMNMYQCNTCPNTDIEARIT
jgi:hypothetical protein